MNKDLRPLELSPFPAAVIFDPAGKLVIEFREQHVEISLIDQSQEVKPRAARLVAPRIHLGWEDGLASPSAIQTADYRIEIGTPRRPGSAHLIVPAADAVFVELGSNSVTTIDFGWFRQWAFPDPRSRR